MGHSDQVKVITLPSGDLLFTYMQEILLIRGQSFTMNSNRGDQGENMKKSQTTHRSNLTHLVQAILMLSVASGAPVAVGQTGIAVGEPSALSGQSSLESPTSGAMTKGDLDSGFRSGDETGYQSPGGLSDSTMIRKNKTRRSTDENNSYSTKSNMNNPNLNSNDNRTGSSTDSDHR